jgi:hypothetical protein
MPLSLWFFCVLAANLAQPDAVADLERSQFSIAAVCLERSFLDHFAAGLSGFLIFSHPECR